MRLLGAIILITFYFVGMLRPIQPYLDYELRKDYIQEFLCVNKDKPITRCLGKCFLKRKLIESQNSSTDSSPFFQVNMDDYPIGFIALFELDSVNSQILKVYSIRDADSNLNSWSARLLRPPIFV